MQEKNMLCYGKMVINEQQNISLGLIYAFPSPSCNALWLVVSSPRH